MSSQNGTPFLDHYVDVQGYKTRYWDVGFSKSVVILVHGFGLSAEIWENNIQELSKSHRVIALDFWGCGKTEATSKHVNIHEYPKFLASFMDALKIKKAKFVSHSLGGLITLKFAFNYPEYVEKIMLVSSAGFTTSVPLHFKLLALPGISKFLTKVSRASFKYAFAKNFYHKHPFTDSYVDALLSYSKKDYAKEHLLNMARSGVTLFGLRRSLTKEVQNEIKQVTCPVLVLWGKNDRIVSYKGASKAKKLIPHARLEMFEKCGHLPQIEYPLKFNEIAHSFL